MCRTLGPSELLLLFFSCLKGALARAMPVVWWAHGNSACLQGGCGLVKFGGGWFNIGTEASRSIRKQVEI